MTGATIAIDDASASDTIQSVKERVFAANKKLPVHRQRLVYRPGPHGMDALADDETLGGAGVAQDGSAELDVLLAELTVAEAEELDRKVCRILSTRRSIFSLVLEEMAAISIILESFPLIFQEYFPCIINESHNQLLGAARYGRVDELNELLSEGANMECTGQVRHMFRHWQVTHPSTLSILVFSLGFLVHASGITCMRS